jgi:hypothetical protein
MGEDPTTNPAAGAAIRAQTMIDLGSRVDAFLGDRSGGTVARSRASVILWAGFRIGHNHLCSTSTLLANETMMSLAGSLAFHYTPGGI